MPAYCNICPKPYRKPRAPALIACKNCGQFACEAHRYLWNSGRSWFCSECWFDSAGQSLNDIALSIGLAAHAAPIDQQLGIEDTTPIFREIVLRLREDPELRRHLSRQTEDAATTLSAILHRTNEILTEYRLRWLLRFLAFLKTQGIEDPNVDYLIGQLQYDPARMADAVASGADPSYSIGAVLGEYRSYLRRFSQR